MAIHVHKVKNVTIYFTVGLQHKAIFLFISAHDSSSVMVCASKVNKCIFAIESVPSYIILAEDRDIFSSIT